MTNTALTAPQIATLERVAATAGECLVGVDEGMGRGATLRKTVVRRLLALGLLEVGACSPVAVRSHPWFRSYPEAAEAARAYYLTAAGCRALYDLELARAAA